MKKITTILILAVFLLSSVSGICYSAAGTRLTNAQFADLLVSVMGLQIPQQVKDLPPDEHFEAVANILATKGIGLFVGAAPDRAVTNRELVNVLYTIAGGRDAALDAREKMSYLVNNGYIPLLNLREDAARDDVTRIFSNPVLMGPVAEAYRVPARETGAGPDFNVIGATRDTPASGT